MGNPDHKRRSDGKPPGSKTSQRQAKVVKATDKLPRAHMEVGNGSERLTLRRIWRMLGGDDQ